MKLRHCLFFAVVLTILTMPLRAQWEQTNGPWTGGYTPSIFIIGSTVFAGTKHGVYLSTDKGMHWQEPQVDSVFGTVVSMAQHGPYLFAGTAYDGLFRSSDGGYHWEWIDDAAPDNFARTLTPSADDNYLFASFFSVPGFYRSSDFGESWELPCDTLTDVWVGDIVLSSDGTLLYALTGKGLLHSSDNGVSWMKTTFTGKFTASTLRCCGNAILVTTNKGGYRSTDKGATWVLDSVLPKEYPFSTIAKDSIAINCYTDAVYISTDCGGHWSKHSNGLQIARMNRVFDACVSADNREVYVATDFGVFYSEISPVAFQEMNIGLPVWEMPHIVSSGGKIAVGSLARGIYQTIDNGDSWTVFVDSLEFGSVYWMETADQFLFASVERGFFRWVDGGLQWQQGEQLDRPGLFFSMESGYDRDNNLVLFGLNDYAVFKSLDTGRTWISGDFNGQFSRDHPIAMQSIGNDDDLVFIGTYGGRIIRSTNLGITWDTTDVGFDDYLVSTMLANDNAVYAGCQTGLYRSVDHGTLWEKFGSGLPRKPIVLLSSYVDVMGSYHMFSNVYPDGLYYSSDSGYTWVNSNQGLRRRAVMDLTFTNEMAFVSTQGHGVYRRPISDFSVLSASPPFAPASMQLHQSYPNPVSVSSGTQNVRISYEIGKPSYISLSVCNVLGTSRVVLVEDYKSTGIHTANFNASGLPPGVYLYRLAAGNWSLQKKLLIIE